MVLNKLYKEIEEAEASLNAKRLKYIKEALAENNGIIKLKFKEFKEFKETNDVFDFDDQFPVVIEIDENPMYLTEVYVKKNDFRIVLLDYDDMTLGDYDNTGDNAVKYGICGYPYRFYIDSYSGYIVEYPITLIEWVQGLKPGTVIKIGNVFSYHY